MRGILAAIFFAFLLAVLVSADVFEAETVEVDEPAEIEGKRLF